MGARSWVFAVTGPTVVAVNAWLVGCDAKAPAPPASQAVHQSAASAAAPSTPASSPATSRPPSSRPRRLSTSRTAMPPERRATSVEFLQRTDPACLRIMSWNIRWDSIFRDARDTRTDAFGRVLRAVSPDVMGLQEIQQHDPAQTAALLNELMPLPDGDLWHVFRGSKGAIASRYPFRFTADDAPHPTHRNPAVAWIDLPDGRFPADLLLINNHFKCCGDEKNDPLRQIQADATLYWLRDAATPGGRFDLPTGSGMVVVGDFNLVGGSGPLDGVLQGDVRNEGNWGADFKPDWDGTELVAAHPRHNRIGSDYTWRDDSGPFPAGRIDFLIYSDSVLRECQSFILNCAAWEPSALAQARLQQGDTAVDVREMHLDHLPLVLDVRFVTENQQPTSAAR